MNNRASCFGKVVNPSTILLAFLFKTEASHKYKQASHGPHSSQHKFKVIFFECSKEVGLGLQTTTTTTSTPNTTGNNLNTSHAHSHTNSPNPQQLQQPQATQTPPTHMNVAQLIASRTHTPSPISGVSHPSTPTIPAPSQITTNFVTSLREIHHHNFLKVLYTFLRAPVPSQMPNMSRQQLLNAITMCQDVAFDIDLSKLLEVKQSVLQHHSSKFRKKKWK